MIYILAVGFQNKNCIHSETIGKYVKTNFRKYLE